MHTLGHQFCLIFGALDDYFVVYMTNHLGYMSHGVSQQIMGCRLHDILASQTTPQAGAGPLFGVCCGFPSGFCVCDVALLIELGIGVAQHTARW
jgi:hypothetical protein